MCRWSGGGQRSLSKTVSILRYVRAHCLVLLTALSLGSATAIVFQELVRQSQLQLLSFPPSRHGHLGLALVFVQAAVAISMWNRLAAFWRRYRRTYTLVRPPIIHEDVFATFIAANVVILAGPYYPLPFASKESLSVLALGIPTYILFVATLVWSRADGGGSERLGSQRREPKGKDHEDYPIANAGDDVLGRGAFVEALYQQITSLPMSASFVFGLQGRWGEGKTSVLNLLRHRLATTPSVLLLDFNPWFSPTEEALISSFYTGLEKTVDTRYVLSGLHRTLRRYRRFLAFGLERMKLKGLDVPSPEPENLRKELEEWIARTGCRVLVLVDDVDRLGASELLAVLKLAALSARMSNVVMILSYDAVVVTEMLRDRLRIDSAFLEKVIQKSIALPPPQQRQIDRFLLFSEKGDLPYRSSIDALLDDLAIGEGRRAEFDETFVHFYQAQLHKLFPTLRHAKRYMNGLRAGLPPVVNEVHLYDFFLLEALRSTSPRIYEDIWLRPWFYVPEWTLEASIRSPFGAAVERRERSAAIRAHIEALLSREPSQEVVLEILKELFFVEVRNAFSGTETQHNSESARETKRLTHAECLPRYFYFEVPGGEVADSRVEAQLEVWNRLPDGEAQSSVSRDLEALRSKGLLLQFLDRIMLFHGQVAPHRVQAVVGALYLASPGLSREGELWSSEHDRAIGLVVRLINDRAEDEAVAPLITEIVEEAPLYFMAAVVLACQRGAGGKLARIAARIEPERLRRLAGERLRRYFIEAQRNILQELPERDVGLVLYQWATDWMTGSEYYAGDVRHYLAGLLDGEPKHAGRLLKIFRTTRTGRAAGLNYEELSAVVDPERVAEALTRIDIAALGVDEEDAVRLFRQGHDWARLLPETP
jgi:KAP-like P-loop domain-containing protein